MKPIPNATVGPAACTAQGKIFILGGCAYGKPLNLIQEYDIAFEIWKKTSLQLPEPFYDCGAIYIPEEKIILIFGMGFKQTYQYNLAGQIRSHGAPCQANGSLLNQAVRKGNNIIVWDSNQGVNFYDLVNKTWTRKGFGGGK